MPPVLYPHPCRLCCTHTHAACVANAATMPCAAAGPSGGDLAHPGHEGIDHNRGEKKFPYAKGRLTALLGGMENVQLMGIPDRLRSQLVALLTIVKPDTTAAINFIFGFWICAFKGVYQCQLGRLRMSVRLLVPTRSCAQPCQPSPPTAHAFCPALPIAAHHSRNQPQDIGVSSLRLTNSGLFKPPHESPERDLCQPFRRSGVLLPHPSAPPFRPTPLPHPSAPPQPYPNPNPNPKPNATHRRAVRLC